MQGRPNTSIPLLNNLPISSRKTSNAYHRDYLREAVLDGVDVFGYFPWGPIDIISCTSSEISKRYGFIYVDMDDYGKGSGKRSLKDSYFWYKKVVTSNGENLS